MLDTLLKIEQFRHIIWKTELADFCMESLSLQHVAFCHLAKLDPDNVSITSWEEQ